MRLIDADALRAEHCEGCSTDIQQDCKNDPVCASLMWVHEAPTIDALPVDAVAQMLFDLFGDGCPCNYNDIAEWLAGSNGCTENCNKNEDPLLCWKLFIKHYGERRSE